MARQIRYSVAESQFGQHCGHRLDGLIGAAHQQTAAASCRFTVQGPRSVGRRHKNWGEWIRTTLCTWGEKPRDGLVWQVSGHWVSGDGHRNMQSILSCFDVSINDVFTLWGHPRQGATYDISLYDVIAICTPTILPAVQTHAVQRQQDMALVLTN